MTTPDSSKPLPTVIAWTLPPQARLFVVCLIASLFGLILYFDSTYPIEFDIPVLYLTPLILSLLSGNKHLPLVLAGSIPVFCAAGFWLSPSGSIETGIFNRALVCLSAFLIAAVLRYALSLLNAIHERTEALIDSVKVLKSFFDSNAVMMGIVEINGDEIVHRADNDAAAAFLRKTPEEVRNRTASELGVPPHIVQAWMNQCRESMRQGKAVKAEYARPYAGDTLQPNHVISLTISFIGMSSVQKPMFSFIKEDITHLTHDALLSEPRRRRPLMVTPQQ